MDVDIRRANPILVRLTVSFCSSKEMFLSASEPWVLVDKHLNNNWQLVLWTSFRITCLNCSPVVKTTEAFKQ